MPIEQTAHEFTDFLTERDERFCQEYLVDLNATRAYLASGSKATRAAAAVEGARYLKKPKIRGRIQFLMEQRSARLRISADDVLLRLWLIATADPRELVEYRIDPCPACSAASGTAAIEPDPNCGRCAGGGVGRVVVHDTRHLSPAASLLYAGIRRSGGRVVEVKLQDQVAALLALSKHMWLDGATRRTSGEAEGTLQKLLTELHERHSPAPGERSHEGASPTTRGGNWRPVDS